MDVPYVLSTELGIRFAVMCKIAGCEISGF